MYISFCSFPFLESWCMMRCVKNVIIEHIFSFFFYIYTIVLLHWGGWIDSFVLFKDTIYTPSLVFSQPYRQANSWIAYPQCVFLIHYRCGFSSSMDIGYGPCTIRPFETPGTTTFLCICSTNNCSNTLAACQNSVDQARSSPPPLLPVVIPTLTNSINCSGITGV